MIVDSFCAAVTKTGLSAIRDGIITAAESSAWVGIHIV
jgi:hypothetical protein